MGGGTALLGLLRQGVTQDTPLKTRFFEGSAFPYHVVADFRKKVRFSPPADGPEPDKTALFFFLRKSATAGPGEVLPY